MNFSQRAKSIAEVAERVRQGAEIGYEVKDLLHEFQTSGGVQMYCGKPVKLAGVVEHGERYDAFLQALAVHLACKLNAEPPSWTQPAIQLPQPWFASSGTAIRNYLLISSPAPFRARNLFIDADSLEVV
jgi:hypothetical protein